MPVTSTRPLLAEPSPRPAAPSRQVTTTAPAGRLGEQRLAALVQAARDGDRAAATQIVEHFDPMVRGIARSYRLQPADVDDVAQATWIDLLEHIGTIRCPEALPGWLATVTRRRVMRTLQRGSRELLTDDPARRPRPPTTTIRRRGCSRRSAWPCLRAPSRRCPTGHGGCCWRTLRSTTTRSALSVPIGSIGPTRARTLSRLSRNGRLCALHRADRAA